MSLDADDHPAADTPAPFAASPILRLSRLIGVWLGHQSIPQMAAALAYRTVFSIIPICVIGLIILKRFVSPDDVDRLFTKFLALAGLTELNQSQAGSVQDRIDALVNAFEKISFTGIGLVSALALIYAAISLLIELENAFNRLYGSTRPRVFHRRIMQYWFVVSLGPLLVALSFFVAERITSFAESLAGGWALGAAAYLSSVAITGSLLWALYSTVPNARVRVVPALYGALTAAVALEAAKYGFQFYLKNASFQSVYGALALIPLFLLWVYITWVIVLTGLRIAYLIQHGRKVTILHVALGSREGASLMDPAFVVQVAATVAQSFSTGKPVDADQVAEKLGLSWELSHRILKRLAEDGLLLPVNDRNTERFTLAKPADAIPLNHILKIAFSMAGEGAATPAFVRTMRQSQLDAAASKSLATLIPAAANTMTKPASGAPAHA